MESVFTSFATALRSSVDADDILSDSGTLAAWLEICDAQIEELDEAEAEPWVLERNTWSLVQALYTERLDNARPASALTDPYAAPQDVFSSFVSRSLELAELSAVRDWLADIAPPQVAAEVRKGYHPYTKASLRQARRTGGRAAPGGVKELDPDATLRKDEKGERRRLETEDANYDRSLLRTLFHYVRAGELPLALDLCRQSDQSWRSASLSGGIPWADSSRGSEAPGVHGNVRRKMWKTVCRRVALADGADPYERALYGALSGDVGSVLPVCEGWEDHLWARLNALFEASLEASLSATKGGKFWADSHAASANSPDKAGDEEDVLSRFQGRVMRPDGGSIQEEVEQIFEDFLRRDIGSTVGQEARNPFRVAMTWLIMGKQAELFGTIVERLEGEAESAEPEQLAHLLRFFAHLLLVLRALKQPVPPQAANAILEGYIRVLETSGEDELVPFYAAQLEQENAVESYALFLTSFGLESTMEDRRQALEKAREHGLDTVAIACRVVEMVLADSLEREQEDRVQRGRVDTQGRVEQREWEMIRSVEWLAFEEGTREPALRQTNALCRYFLSNVRPHVARELLARLPREIVDFCASVAGPEGSSHLTEYLDYARLFSALDVHDAFLETWAQKPRSAASKLEMAEYGDVVKARVDQFWEEAADLLRRDWLKLDFGRVEQGSEEEEEVDERRKRELLRIRQLYVPEVVFRLHSALFESRAVLPASLARAFDLANLVADEKYQVYLDFLAPSAEDADESGNKMKDYLERVKEAAMEGLARGKGTDPFVVQ